MLGWLIVSLPFFSMLLLVIFAFLWGKRPVLYLSAVLAIIHMIITTIFCFNALNTGLATISSNQYVWVELHDLFFTLSIKYDELSLCMAFVVSIISNSILLYSAWYMEHDPAIIKFQAILFFFTFSMCLLITSDNFFQFFIGWECIGLASFLLISHWINRNDAVNGGLKAILYNRVGDASFLIALSFIYATFKSLTLMKYLVVTNPSTTSPSLSYAYS